VNPRLDEDELRRFYEQFDYFFSEHTASDAEIGHAYDQKGEDHEESHERLELLERFLPAKGRLLEVGCATGFNLLAARKRGWDTVGVEVSTVASTFARERHGLDVRTGTLGDAHLPTEHFDAAAIYHVLEHVGSPSYFLGRLHSHLVPNGILAVEVPDFSSRLSQKLGPAWHGIAPPEHIYHFEEGSLKRLLIKSGFQVLQVRRRGGAGVLFHGVPSAGTATGFRARLFQTRKLLYRSQALKRWIRRLYWDSLRNGESMHVIARKRSDGSRALV
jgi:SAM-dependent methyltransferase